MTTCYTMARLSDLKTCSNTNAYASTPAAQSPAGHSSMMETSSPRYGDAYIVPTYNLLDDLAEEFGFTEADKALKQARESSRLMVKLGRSATCDYVEANRREVAIRFVTNAFNARSTPSSREPRRTTTASLSEKSAMPLPW